jgi:hypothetical protein
VLKQFVDGPFDRAVVDKRCWFQIGIRPFVVALSCFVCVLFVRTTRTMNTCPDNTHTKHLSGQHTQRTPVRTTCTQNTCPANTHTEHLSGQHTQNTCPDNTHTEHLSGQHAHRTRHNNNEWTNSNLEPTTLV